MYDNCGRSFLTDLCTFVSDIFEKLKCANYNDLEDMVHRMELIYNEIVVILDIIYFGASTTGSTLPPEILES